jgi:hypothetical protein
MNLIPHVLVMPRLPSRWQAQWYRSNDRNSNRTIQLATHVGVDTLLDFQMRHVLTNEGLEPTDGATLIAPSDSSGPL